jgi:hypothetical protein
VTCFALSWFNLLSLQRNIKDAVLWSELHYLGWVWNPLASISDFALM